MEPPTPIIRPFPLKARNLLPALLCLLFFSPFSAASQSLHFRHFDIQNGLPGNIVGQTIQDKDGFTWIATDQGLARFDGYQFQGFEFNPQHKSQGISGVCLDPKGQVWCFTYERQLFRFKEDRLIPHPANEQLRQIGNVTSPSMVVIEADETIWMAFDIAETKSSLVRISPDNKVELISPTANPREIKFYLKFLNQNQFIAGSQFYIKVNLPSIVIQPDGSVHKIKAKITRTTNFNFDCFPAQDGSVWMLLENKIYKFRPGDTPKPIGKIDDMYLNGGMEARDGKLWLPLKNGGVKILDPNNLKKSEGHVLKNKSINHIRQDREGGVWISTTEGLFYSPAQQILTFPARTFFEDKVLTNLVSDKGELYVFAMEKGYYQFNEQSENKFDLIGFESPTLLPLYRLADSSEFPEQAFGRFYKPGTTPTLKEFHEKAKIGHDPNAAYENRKGPKLLALHPNFAYEWTNLKGRHPGMFDPDGKNTQVAYRDSNGQEWLGRIDGLYKLINRRIIFEGTNTPLLKTSIKDILEFGDKLLLASEGNGLIIKEGDKIWNIGTKDGLIGNSCYQVKVDHENEVWVATSSGVSRITSFHKINGQFEIINYTESDGLLCNETYKLAIAGNNVWAMCSSGLSKIPRSINKVVMDPAPLISIRDVRVNHQSVNWGNVLELSHRENNLEVTFAGISYKSANKIRYKYRMEGIDTAWHYTDQNKINFPYLPPGEFTFTVMAENHQGIWSEIPAKIHMIVAPPYWQRWWFYVLIGVGVFIPVFLASRYRESKLKREAQLLRASLDSEQKALKAQVKPHFLFNALNSISMLIANNDKIFAVSHVAKFARLMRQTLDNSDRDKVSLAEELNTLNLYLELEALRFTNQFEHSITVGNNIDPEMISIAPMLIQPYVENAIWHGLMNKKEGIPKLEIEVVADGPYLICRITDNGVGREAAEKLKEESAGKKKSYGMSLSKERLKLMNGTKDAQYRVSVIDLHDEEGKACGTTVEITMPLDQ